MNLPSFHINNVMPVYLRTVDTGSIVGIDAVVGNKVHHCGFYNPTTGVHSVFCKGRCFGVNGSEHMDEADLIKAIAQAYFKDLVKTR